jgi:hypothetical protein
MKHHLVGEVHLILLRRCQFLVYPEPSFRDNPNHVPQVRGCMTLDFVLLCRRHVVGPEQAFHPYRKFQRHRILDHEILTAWLDRVRHPQPTISAMDSLLTKYVRE